MSIQQNRPNPLVRGLRWLRGLFGEQIALRERRQGLDAERGQQGTGPGGPARRHTPGAPGGDISPGV